MLVLSRKVEEEIWIGHDIRLKVIAVRGDRVFLGIAAPDEVRIDRLEYRRQRERTARHAVLAAARREGGT